MRNKKGKDHHATRGRALQANALFVPHGEKLPLLPRPLCAAAIGQSTAAGKLPIQVCAASSRQSRKREEEEEEWNPILPLPFSPFLVHIMSPQLSPFIHTCAPRRERARDGPPHIPSLPLLTACDLPIDQLLPACEFEGAVKREGNCRFAVIRRED